MSPTSQRLSIAMLAAALALSAHVGERIDVRRCALVEGAAVSAYAHNGVDGAGTAAGMINGFGSIGAIVGVTLPGILSGMLSEGADIWFYIFPGLGVSLVIAAVLLLPKWNTLPATEKTA